MTLHTRLATPADAAAIARIYNQGIADRVATFETRGRSEAEVRGWFDASHPIVVAGEGDGPSAEVVAFAASGSFRSRDWYRGIAEISIYVDRAHRGRGAGRLALEALCLAAAGAGLWKLLGAALEGNRASVALLQRCGFREVGRYRRQARLEGAWRDVVLLERLIPENQVQGPAKVVFAGAQGAGRAQMAAAFFELLADPARAFAVAAGAAPGARVHPAVAEAMGEEGLAIAEVLPRALTPELLAGAALLVNVGGGDACPEAPGARRDDWPLADPGGLPLAEVRPIRDRVRALVAALVAAEGWGRAPG